MTYTAHVAGRPRAYHAVVKLDGREVWRSAETFHNRDETTCYAVAARDVARQVVFFLNAADPDAELAAAEVHFSRHGYRFHGSKEQLAIRRWCAKTANAIKAASPADVGALAGGNQ